MSLSHSTLQTVGLSQNEADLYEILVKRGEVPVSTLIRESKLKRPTVYKILDTLKNKGLAQTRDIKKIIHARPESPAKLMELADKQYETIERTRASLQSFLPSLSLLYTQSTEKPVVRIFEGVEGLKQIYEDTLREGKPIYALVQMTEINPEIFQWLTKTYAKKRARAKIHAKVIVSSGKWANEYKSRDAHEYRTTILVPSDKFPFHHEVDIYGDKIAFIHYRKDEPLIGYVIQHTDTAKTMKAWFDLAWIGACR